jgi:hypothetical protein
MINHSLVQQAVLQKPAPIILVERNDHVHFEPEGQTMHHKVEKLVWC